MSSIFISFISVILCLSASEWGSQGQETAANDSLVGNETDADRRDVGGGGGARSDTRHQESTLRGEPDRSGNLRAGHLAVVLCLLDCKLLSSAAHDEGRSAPGS